VGFLIILVVGFALMWLLIVLPQRRRQAAHAALLESLEPGDEIVSAGGLYGTITSLGEDELSVEIAEGVKVRMAKRAVAARMPPDEDDDVELEAAAAIEEPRG
jgi:preprotein translocase subunit YajC